MSMPGKQARVLCPVCAEPMPPDETECANCGAFVIDEAVVRLSRAFGLDREKALKLFEAGFRHTKQLRDRDPNGVLEKGEVGLLFICTNCGGFVASGDTTCPRCAAEFETEPTVEDMEEDILDLRLCPICGADNDPELEECEVCGGPLRETKEPSPVAATESPSRPPATATARGNAVLDKVDEFIQDLRPPAPPLPPTGRPGPRTPARSSRTTARPPAPVRTRITGEMAGGRALAASTSLLLAGVLNQPLVSGGIAAFLIGLSAYLAAEYVRSRSPRPPGFDGALLAAGSILALSALLPRGLPLDANAAVALTLAAIIPFAGATRSLSA